jgi:nitroreductase
MHVKDAILTRRSYRAIEACEITDELITTLATAAQLMPSCFNKQPWRYGFIYEAEQLKRVKDEALAEGNQLWAKPSSLIIVIYSAKDLDCVIGDREYYLFDTGLATGAMLLRATELGLVAHPIAGYDPVKVREITGIPEKYNVIALVIVGKKAESIPESFPERLIESEQHRPSRTPIEEFSFQNRYSA